MSILDTLKGLVNAGAHKQGRGEEGKGEAEEELERAEDRADAKAEDVNLERKT